MAKTIEEAVNALKAARAELTAADTQESAFRRQHVVAALRADNAMTAVEYAQKELYEAIDAKVKADDAAAALQATLPLLDVAR